MPIPGAEIVIGLFVNVVVWFALWAVRTFVRAIKVCCVDHPGLTLLISAGAWKLGWIAEQLGPENHLRYPFLAALLLLMFTARLFGEHPPTGLPRELHRMQREITRHIKAKAITDWIGNERHRRRVEDLKNRLDRMLPGLPAGPEHSGRRRWWRGAIDVHEAVPTPPAPETTPPHPGSAAGVEPIELGPVTTEVS